MDEQLINKIATQMFNRKMKPMRTNQKCNLNMQSIQHTKANKPKYGGRRAGRRAGSTANLAVNLTFRDFLPKMVKDSISH